MHLVDEGGAEEAEQVEEMRVCIDGWWVHNVLFEYKARRRVLSGVKWVHK